MPCISLPLMKTLDWVETLGRNHWQVTSVPIPRLEQFPDSEAPRWDGNWFIWLLIYCLHKTYILLYLENPRLYGRISAASTSWIWIIACLSKQMKPAIPTLSAIKHFRLPRIVGYMCSTYLSRDISLDSIRKFHFRSHLRKCCLAKLSHCTVHTVQKL